MAGDIESIVGKLYDIFPYKKAQVWKNMFFHPHETMTRQFPKADLRTGIKDLAVAYLPYWIVLGISYLFSVLARIFLSFLFGTLEGGVTFGTAYAAFQGVTVGFAYLIGLALLNPLTIVVISLISILIYHALARLFGGKGTFTELFYINAQISGGFYLVYAVITLLSIIPCIGILFSLLSVALSFYIIYLQVKAIRFVHKFSRARAIAVYLLPVFIILFLFALALVFGIFSLATLAALASAG